MAAVDDVKAYEKLGAFYLGRRILASGEASRESILYHSKDLTTHAVIIGMTGSGKTGLGLGLIEEAAIDKIPVIAIDPKGDLGNLMLNFPAMQGRDLAPWVDPQSATSKGLSQQQYAEAQAKMWREGLADWDQPLARIQALRDAADINIYTPGSSAGIPVSVLQSFTAPSLAIREDYDAYAQRIQATTTGILTLLSLDADPLTSREHILIANILQYYWDKGEGLEIAGLIGAVQNPPIARIGVMSLDSVYPAKDRFALAMRMNGLLASPGFAAWMQGVPLDARRLFYTEAGKPRVSVMSIAHLSDTERMFFVTMLLSEIINWMRAQPGTGSLRAILYMDEIFGYMPPTANPPSKILLLLLLKQARAFGLGVVLSTQNPVDLDYKGLSNTGTWFIGRLQTDRDKQRVLDGLLGAAAGTEVVEKSELERTLSGLGQRQFLLHNVHANGYLEVFTTRWVMSYLAGPLTREQIKRLTEEKANTPAGQSKPLVAAQLRVPTSTVSPLSMAKPSLAPDIPQYYLAASIAAPETDSTLCYQACLVAAAEVLFSSKKHNIERSETYVLGVNVDDRQLSVEWHDAETLKIDINELSKRGEKAASFRVPAPSLEQAKNYGQWEKQLKRYIRTERGLILYRSARLKLSSEPGETEGDFRIRLQTLGNEQRDLAAGKLRNKYGAKVQRLEERLRKAEQAIAREESQASQQKLDTMVSIGSTILGALFGGGRKSSTARRAGSAVSKANRIRKESQDVEDAQENAEALRSQLTELERALQQELATMGEQWDSQLEQLEEVVIRAMASNIHIPLLGLLWRPYWQAPDGFTEPAF
ncbi:helicase HerA domain-containing protein [Zhongshania sp.]|uniref:ATP-binding protein n=1 Tax=Zhongshania sp. TaxID=1971902 RepID=UPI003565F3C4